MNTTCCKAVLVLLLAAACGGGNKPDTTPTQPDDQASSGSGGPVEPDNSGNMMSADKTEEAERDLKRKEAIMPKCLSAAMDAGEMKHGAHGKVALEIVVDNGKASSVKLIKSDFPQSVNDCVIKHVQEITFPHMIKPYETSHTYPMEAN
jgi:hypothetical protein